MKPLALSVIGLTVIACSSSDRDDSRKQPAAQPAPASPTAGDEPGPSAAEEPSLQEHMTGHFTAVLAIERALVDGDLDAAKKQAAWVAEHQPHDAVEAWDPHLKAMEEAARALTEAGDLVSASKLAAALGSECAACHVATTAISSFPYTEPPAEGADNKSMMKRHQWATDRLWEGLIGPSETSWVDGAEMLAKAPFIPQVTLLEKDRQTVEGLAKRVQALGAKAVGEEDVTARSAIYAELLATCSGCHGIARKRER